MINELAINTQGRDFVVGDLHGCLDELYVLLNHVSFDRQKDRLIAVGDLIDRGANSLACLKLLEMPWFSSVLGNHEKLLIDYMLAAEGEHQTEVAGRWRRAEGYWFFELNSTLQQHCYQLAVALPWVILMTAGRYRYCVIHAEWPPEINRLDVFLTGVRTGDPHIQRSCLSGRRRHQAKYDVPIEGISYVLCGHTPAEHQCALGNMRNLDYGAFALAKRGALCLLELGSHRRYLLRKEGIVEQAFGAASL